MILLLACAPQHSAPEAADPPRAHSADATLVRWVLYADTDGDGFGAGPSVPRSSGPEPGWVLVAGDCDDTRSNVHPGTTERCDGVDEDCDGEVDDNATDALTWFVDGDGDGFGGEIGGGCTPPATAVDVSGDCDDVEASAHPGGTEVCGDEVDQDCSGADLRCRPGGTVTDFHSEWIIASNVPWLTISSRIATGGDVDGDGRPDVAFGTSSDWHAEPADHAGAWLLPHLPDERQIIDGTEPRVMYRDDAYWFWGLYLIDDVSGDGRSELAIAWEDPGCLQLFTTPPTTEVSADEGDHAICVDGGTAVGDALAQLEDGAIAVSGINNIYDEGWLEQAGRVWVIEDPWSANDVSADADAWLMLHRDTEEANLGTSLCSGDLDGDGLRDLAVGARSYEGPGWTKGGLLAVVNAPFSGEIQLADSDGSIKDADGLFTGASGRDMVGAAASCGGDVNGDGLRDVLVEAWEGRTSLLLFLGPATGEGVAPLAATWRVDTTADGKPVQGSTLDSDLDGDGLHDIVASRSASDNGLIYWGGSLEGTVSPSDADVVYRVSDPVETFGEPVGGSDFDGDGYDDVLVSFGRLSDLAWWGGGIGVIYGGAIP